MIPRELRAAVSRHLLPRTVNERLSLHWKTAGIDWSRTRAFTIENANEGYLRLNLRGREPQGVVEPGAEYAALCGRLAAAARSLRNPANGKPAACAVHCTDELFSGPCRPMLPDVIINWDPDARITTEIDAQGVGVIRSPQAGYAVSPFYTGNHRPSAFLAAAGPHIRAGASLEAAGILDLAPTILAHFGLAVPPSMHGTVLEFGASARAAEG
jgi:predicted AlkP superfamily phosphohydrolase/phosphomutase